jgi:hypothetical protein
MNPTINALVAGEHAADLRRAAERDRRDAEQDRRAAPRRHANPRGSRDASPFTIELRLLGSDEAHVVRRLAALDDAPELEGQALVALIGGEAVAALSLEDRRVVANPFVRTSDAVSLLRLRAAQLPKARRRSPRRLHLVRSQA